MIKKIVVCHFPRLDIYVAIWLLRKFGELFFPGVKTAEIVLLSGKLEKQSEGERLKDGVLCVGFGNGSFDVRAKKADCVTSLVANAINIKTDPALIKLIEFVVYKEVEGKNYPFDLAGLVVSMNHQYPENPDIVYTWLNDVFEAKYVDYQRILKPFQFEFERIARTEKIPGYSGSTLKLAVLESDDPLVDDFIKSDFKNSDIAFLVHRRGTGHTQIITNRRFGLLIQDIVQLIRLSEQKNKKKVVTYEWKELALPGFAPGVEEWQYDDVNQTLINANFGGKLLPTTKLTLAKIVELVKLGANPKQFEPATQMACLRGQCYSRPGTPCPLYCFGLHRCRLIRHHQHNG